MKRRYESVELKWIYFYEEDVIRTSNNDNVENLPEFPEEFTN